MSAYFVQIVRYSDSLIEKEIGPYTSERSAERADDGVNRNLDHENYYTLIVSRPIPQDARTVD